MVVAGNRSEVTVQLKPDHLGRMKVIAESTTAGLVVRIATESPAAKQLLESNLPGLQHALQDQGLKIERIDILVQERSDPWPSAGHRQQQLGHRSGTEDGTGQGAYTEGREASIAAPVEIPVDPVALAAMHPNSTFHTVA